MLDGHAPAPAQAHSLGHKGESLHIFHGGAPRPSRGRPSGCLPDTPAGVPTEFTNCQRSRGFPGASAPVEPATARESAIRCESGEK